jgi:rhodanese-related sulfurtransferase
VTDARIDAYLAEVRRQLQRVDAAQAALIAAAGGLLVDTRPSELRRRDGEIPGALIIDRNVLEWRLDPTCPHRHRALGPDDQDREVVVFCDEGYASSLAAVSLRAVGLRRATDLIGGFQAWRAAGHPVTPAPKPAGGATDG